eukprot:7140643-Lingulodinium_polyedra.AAC.1
MFTRAETANCVWAETPRPWNWRATTQRHNRYTPSDQPIYPIGDVLGGSGHHGLGYRRENTW